MAKDETTKHTLNLFRGDYKELQSLYPDVGAGPVIRKIVRRFLEQARSGTEQKAPKVEVKI